MMKKKRLKIIIPFIAAILLVIALGVLPFSFSNSIEIGYAASGVVYSDAPITGSEEYFYIENENDFRTFTLFANQPAEIQEGAPRKVFILNTDIYLERLPSNILTGISHFRGSFYGNGHTVSGLNLSPGGLGYFFGTVYPGAIIKDLNIVNASVKNLGSTDSPMGFVAYLNGGEIDNVKVEGSVSDDSENARGFAGIAGTNIGTVKNCYVSITSSISNAASAVGGIVGVNGYAVITGGVIEPETVQSGDVSESHFDIVSALGVSDGSASYYIPDNDQDINDVKKGNYTAPVNNYLSNDVDNNLIIKDYFDLIAFTNISGGVTAKQYTEINLFNRELPTFRYNKLSGDGVYNKNGFGFYNTDTYSPELRTAPTAKTGLTKSESEAIMPSGSGTASDPYLISMPEELMWAAKETNFNANTYIKLKNSLSLENDTVYYDIAFGEFPGVFDGGGFAISGLTNRAPLFSVITGTVKNLYIKGVSETGAILAGKNQGTVRGVQINAKISNGGAALAAENSIDGIIENSTVYLTDSALTGYAVVKENLGTVKLTRNLSDAYFVGENSGKIELSFSASEFYNTLVGEGLVSESVKVSDNQYVAVNENGAVIGLYDLINTSRKNAWGETDVDWAFKNGVGNADIPTLVFPSDAVCYKKINENVKRTATVVYSPQKEYFGAGAAQQFFGVPESSIVEWYDKDGNIINNNFSNAAQYKALIKVPSTDVETQYTIEGTLTINRITQYIGQEAFESVPGVISGGFQESNYVVYKAAYFDIADIVPADVYEGAVITRVITYYQPDYGYVPPELPAELRNAGTYTINVKVTHQNYNFTYPNSGDSINITFRIAPAPLTINPYFINSNVVYNTELNVNYTAVGILTGDAFADMNTSALEYVTDYVKGVTGITKGKKLTVSVREKDEERLSNNYSVTGGSADFEVVAADIPNDAIEFSDKSVSYNGKYHTLTLSKIPETATVKYMYNGAAVPEKGFIDSEVYEISATVHINENYNDKVVTATLSINRAEITVSVVSQEICWNEAAEGFSLESYELFIREDGKADSLGNPTYRCSYVRGDSTNGRVGDYTISATFEIVNNYRITVREGKLTVKKAKRVVVLNENTKEYDGNPFNPSFSYWLNGVLTQYGGSVAISAWYKADNGAIDENNPFHEAPKDVGDYALRARFATDSEFEELVIDCYFKITLKSHGANEFITDDGVDISNFYDYNGNEITVSLKNPLPEGVVFDFRFTYELNGTKYISYDSSISLKDAGIYTNITLTAENANYAQLVISMARIEIRRAVLVINDIPDVYYDTEVKAPQITTDSEKFGQTVNLSYKVYYYDSGIEETNGIINPGKYRIKIISDNPNFYVQSDKTFEVLRASVTVDMEDVGIIEGSFGDFRGRISRDIEIEIGGSKKTLSLVLVVFDNENFLAPTSGAYSITSIKPYIAENGTEAIVFAVVNGGDKVKISKKELDLSEVYSWCDYRAQYNYTGYTLTVGKEVPESYFTDRGDRVTSNPVGLTLRLDREIKNVGDYVLTATFSQTSYYKATAGTESYSIKVLPANLSIAVNSYSIVFGDSIPEITGTVTGAKGLDIINPVYTTDYISGAPVGSYSTDATYIDSNYTVTVTKGSFDVTKASMANITVQNTEVFYNGSEQRINVIGAPTGARILYSATPVNAGTYDITVTVKMDNYNDFVTQGKIEIKKAVPSITLDKISGELSGNFALTDEMIEGIAEFNGVAVSGNFRISGEYKFVLGDNTCYADFISGDANFNDVLHTAFTLNLTLQENAVKPNIDGAEIGDTIYYSDSNLVIYIDTGGLELENAKMFINGEAVEGLYYIFEGSKENVLLEIFVGNEVVYSRSFNIVYEPNDGETDPPDVPDDNEDNEDNPNDKPDDSAEKDEKNKKTLIIALSAGGALVAAVVAVVIIIMVKRRKNED